MSALFVIYGQDLDIGALLASLEPQPRLIFRQGTPVRRKEPRGALHSSSKLLYRIGDAGWGDTSGQFRAALEFMRDSGELIRKIVDFPGVTTAGFNHPLEQQEGPVVRIALPADYIAEAASLGISTRISYYGYWNEEVVGDSRSHCRLRVDGAGDAVFLPGEEPISRADEDHFDDQIDDAENYLVKWRSEIHRLRGSTSGQVVLEFPIRFQQVLCNNAFLTSSFLKAAGAAGIAVELAFLPLPFP